MWSKRALKFIIDNFNNDDCDDRSIIMRQKNVLKTTLIVLYILVFMQIILTAGAKEHEMPENSCADCHRKMLFTSDGEKNFVDVRIKHIESGISCSIVCHEDKLNKSTGSTYGMWSISTHALFEVTCEKCHGGDPSKVTETEAHKGISNKSISRKDTPQMCGKCHEPELDEFKSSMHYKILESGQEGPAPACVTCHQAHSVRVLTSSEIEDFCSNCHNNITGINPAVPKKAQVVLRSLKELQLDITKARGAIISAKEMGRDVSTAEADLEAAKTILKDAPSVWHRFNLTYFDIEIHKGIEMAKNAEKVMPEGTAKSTPEKTPGFGISITILCLIWAYFRKGH